MSQIFKPLAATPPPPGFLETLTSVSDSVVVTPNASDTIFIGTALVSARSQPFITVGLPAPNTLDLQIQVTTASATSILNNVGLASFNSAHFSVDSFGYVSLAGGGQAIDSIGVDTNTPPGTNPVLPDTNGLITVTGAQVAAGTTTNVIRTDSLAANTYTIQIQRSQAVASTTIGDNGVSHFDSARFTVDANGFVSTVGTAFISSVAVDANTAPGTNPVLPNASGQITVTGAQVAAGTTTNVIRTDSLAANTYTIQIQRSQAVASSTIGDNGVCHFNSAQFTVDANGFVTSLGAGFVWIDQATSTTLVKNTGYFVTAATTQTLPASPSQGDVVKVVADTTGAVAVTANTGQVIRVGNLVSSTAGSMTSTLRGDSLELVFRAATSTWISIATTGVWVAA